MKEEMLAGEEKNPAPQLTKQQTLAEVRKVLPIYPYRDELIQVR
jgi:hypothetical protein